MADVQPSGIDSTNGGSLPAFEADVTRTIASVEDMVMSRDYVGSISAYKTIPIFDALYDCRLTQAQLTCWSGAVAGSSSVYWTVILRRTRGGIPTAVYDAAVLADVPSAYWKLGEPSGTSAADSSAGGTATGTYQGTFTLAQSPPPFFVDSVTAVALDGITGTVSIPSNTTLNLGNGPFTLEAIFKRTTLGVQQAIIHKDTAYALYIQPNDRLAFGASGATHSPKALSRNFIDQGWHHVAATFDGTTAKLYLDGVDVTSDQTTDQVFADNATALKLGSKPGGSNFMPGSLMKVAVYKSALSATRIAAHAQAAFGGAFIATKLTLPLTATGSGIPHPGGEPIVQYTPWTFDAINLDNNTLQPGDIIDAILIPTGSPAALADPRFSVRYEAVS